VLVCTTVAEIAPLPSATEPAMPEVAPAPIATAPVAVALVL
jgi:hypothetical protein